MRFEKKVERLRIEKHQGKETEGFLKDVVKMAEGEAFEYVLGEVDFCGAKIDLALRPMIPRSETEYWVKIAIEESKSGVVAREKASPFRALDLFSGSGCIGLAFLKNIEDSHLDMIEKNDRLKSQIEISCNKNNFDMSRVLVITGDIWEGAEGLYDVITAVPPYVPPQMYDEVMEELHSEEAGFFFDKEDGYYYHRQVISRAKEFLISGGVLYLEFDMTQREKIEKLVKEYDLRNFSFIKDPYGHEYLLRVKMI